MPSSPEFNAICYLNRYQDVTDHTYEEMGTWNGLPIKVKVNYKERPYDHYVNHGMKEGKVPGCDLPGTMFENTFSSAAYLARYYDVANDPVYKNDPLLHYQTWGIKEGRHPGYEIITDKSPDGIVSPGTTKFVTEVVEPVALPEGDGTVVTTPEQQHEQQQQQQQADVSKNKMILYVGAALALLLLLKKPNNNVATKKS